MQEAIGPKKLHIVGHEKKVTSERWAGGEKIESNVRELVILCELMRAFGENKGIRVACSTVNIFIAVVVVTNWSPCGLLLPQTATDWLKCFCIYRFKCSKWDGWDGIGMDLCYWAPMVREINMWGGGESDNCRCLWWQHSVRTTQCHWFVGLTNCLFAQFNRNQFKTVQQQRIWPHKFEKIKLISRISQMGNFWGEIFSLQGRGG